MSEVLCANCFKVVPVTEIYISAGSYSIYRDVLLKSISKYKRLLNEAENELHELKNNGNGSDEAAIRRVNRLIKDLKEMLDGGRANPRAPGGNASIKYTIHDISHDGGLINLSTSGICVDIGKISQPLHKGDHVSLSFGGEEPFSVDGQVMWARKGNQAGIKFQNMDKLAIKRLHDYMLDRIPEIREKLNKRNALKTKVPQQLLPAPVRKSGHRGKKWLKRTGV
jgi:hypothetical protein